MRNLYLTLRRFYHVSKCKVEIEDCSVKDYIFKGLTQHGNKTALIDGQSGGGITYNKLHSDVENVSQNLQLLGLQKGDVVCLHGSNAPEFASVFCGVTQTGAALTIANSQLTQGELSQQIKEAGARMLIVTEDCAEKAKAVMAHTKIIERVIVLGDHDQCTPYKALTKPCPVTSSRLPRIVSRDDVALIPFSSGTTGLPKGVQLTHRNIVAQLTALRQPLFLPFGEGDSSLSMLPMVHIAGLVIGMLNPLAQGATVVTLPRFKPETFLDAVQKYRTSFSLIAPPVVNFLANDPRVLQYDISSLTTPYSGAASLGADLTQQMVDRLGLNGIRQGYGMSEASPATHTTPSDSCKYGSIGIPIPNTDSKIVDIDTGETLGANQNGEIWVRGPQVMKGYLNNPEATKQAITDDGWLKTGDIGYYDDDGHYYVVDRLKEIIKYKGYQIAPAYLESILLSNECVQDAAVVGVAHTVHGHIPKAYVVPCTGKHMTTTSLQQFVNERVAPYKQLRGGVEFVSELPRSPSGKLLRRMLQ